MCIFLLLNVTVCAPPQATIVIFRPNKDSTTRGRSSLSSSLCPSLPLPPPPHVYKSHALSFTNTVKQNKQHHRHCCDRMLNNVVHFTLC